MWISVATLPLIRCFQFNFIYFDCLWPETQILIHNQANVLREKFPFNRKKPIAGLIQGQYRFPVDVFELRQPQILSYCFNLSLSVPFSFLSYMHV